MTSDLRSIIAEVEAAVAGASAERRAVMLRDVTGLFAAAADRLTDALAAAFDAVLVRLAQDVGPVARARLSRALAAHPNAPPLIVRDLAYDASVDVAGPLLERHPGLSEDDLASLADRRDQGHLLAISRRSAVGKTLTDTLLNRGRKRVLHALVGNAGAQFSERGFITLIGRGQADPALLVALRQRDDVPPMHRKRLLGLKGGQSDRLLDFEFGPEAQQALMDSLA